MTHRPTRRRAVLAGLLAFSIGVSACGSDETDQSGTPETSPATDATTEATDAPADTPVDTPADTTPETESPPSTDAPTTATEAPDDADDPADEVVEERAIVALDEQVAIQLLSVGIRPTMVLTTLSSEVFAALNADEGLETVDFIIAEPSFEVIAGLAPDVLVGIASPFITDRTDEYEAIAPLILAPLDATWQEQLELIADEFGVTDRAASVIGAVDALTAETAATIDGAGGAGTSVSVLTVRLGNTLAVTAGGATGQVLADAGLTRPEPQLASGAPGVPFVPVSEENLVDHDADIVVTASGAVFDLQPLLESPVYGQLSAVQGGTSFEVVGDLWVLGGTGLATAWVLEDLRALLVDGGTPATLDDTVDRWAEFLALAE
ncbi:MAG: ABC transporter substrate-binding protein [Actinomycetota bacterium]